MAGLLGCVPLMPLLGFIVLALAGGRLPKVAVTCIGVGSVAVSALLTAVIAALFLQYPNQPVQIMVADWMHVGGLFLPFGFYLDALSLTMIAVVTGVGFLIHLYSSGFMADDAGYARFFAYMNWFVAAMLVLVLADNLALLYLGWEGVGLGSYLLIGFWYENPNNGYAARKAFVMTRIGDAALLLGLLLLFTQLKTLDIQLLMEQAAGHWTTGAWLPIAAAALLLGGAVGKSAQLPLQTWLPDAMAGPTPVSALIHAATMVTAGVYLIARTHVLFALAPPVQLLVAVIGTLTLLMAACSALVQTDIKRILAYSTISQIGYMFLGLGVGAWTSAIFHLLTHAFFKALLFLSAGAVIFCCHHEHNIFKMGGLRKPLPLTFWSFMVGSAALSALPFTSGFYSKHEILLAAFQTSPALWLAGCVGAVLTGIYSFRLVFVVFFGEPNLSTANRIGWKMAVPLGVLLVLAVIGALLRIPLGTVSPALAKPENVFDFVSVVAIAAPFIGLVAAMVLYLGGVNTARQPADEGKASLLRAFLFSGWGLDALYRWLWIDPFTTLARLNKSDTVDRLYGVVIWLSRQGHAIASLSQTGRIRRYASSMLLGTVLMLAIGWLS